MTTALAYRAVSLGSLTRSTAMAEAVAGPSLLCMPGMMCSAPESVSALVCLGETDV